MKRISKIIISIQIILMLFPCLVNAIDIYRPEEEDINSFVAHYDKLRQTRWDTAIYDNDKYSRIQVVDGQLILLKEAMADNGTMLPTETKKINMDEVFVYYLTTGSFLENEKSIVSLNNEQKKLLEDLRNEVQFNKEDILIVLKDKNNVSKISKKLKDSNTFKETSNNPQDIPIEEVYNNPDLTSGMKFTKEEQEFISEVIQQEKENNQNNFIQKIFNSMYDQAVGGIINLLTGVCDGMINFMQDTFLPGSFSAVEQLGANNTNLNFYRLIVPVESSILFTYSYDYKDQIINEEAPDGKTRYSLPHIYFSTAAILTNNIPAFDIDFFKTRNRIDYNFYSGSMSEYASKYYLLYSSQNELARNLTSEFTNEKVKENYHKMKQKSLNSVEVMSPSISKWFIYLRNFSIGILAIELVYIGIRILLSTASQKARHKELLAGWLKAFSILMTIVFFMILAIKLTDILVGSFDSVYNPQTGDFLMNYIRTKIAIEATLKNYSLQFAYLIIYFVTIYYTIYYASQYFLRVFYIAMLTIISPLVSISYGVDVIGDGRAQAFNKWMREFSYQLVLQPLQLIAYTIFVSTSVELIANGGKLSLLLALIALTFIRKSEEFLRHLFIAPTIIQNDHLNNWQRYTNNINKNIKKFNKVITDTFDDRTKEINSRINIIKDEMDKAGLKPATAMPRMNPGATSASTHAGTRDVNKALNKLIALNGTIKRKLGLKKLKNKSYSTNNDKNKISISDIDDLSNISSKDYAKLINKAMGKLGTKKYKLINMLGTKYYTGNSEYKMLDDDLIIKKANSQKDILNIYKHAYGKNYMQRYLKDMYNLRSNDIKNIESIQNSNEKNNIDEVANNYVQNKLLVDLASLSPKLELELSKSLENSQKLELIDKLLDELERLLGDKSYQIEAVRQIRKGLGSYSNYELDNNLTIDDKNKIDNIVKENIEKSIDNSNVTSKIVNIEGKDDFKALNSKKNPLDLIKKLDWGDAKLSKVNIKVHKKGKKGVQTYTFMLPHELAKQVEKTYKKAKNNSKPEAKISQNDNASNMKNIHENSKNNFSQSSQRLTELSANLKPKELNNDQKQNNQKTLPGGNIATDKNNKNTKVKNDSQNINNNYNGFFDNHNSNIQSDVKPQNNNLKNKQLE